MLAVCKLGRCIVGNTALKAGPWFPYLQLYGAAINRRDHCVHRPRGGKSAGKINQAAAAFAAAAGGAGAAVGKDDESVLPPQKKARHEEGGSK